MFSLVKWVHEHKDDKFEWGVSDCCLFVSDYVLEATGHDPASSHRGTYSTEIGAKRSLLKNGTIEESFDEFFERGTFGFAQRGDVVLYTSELGETLGIKWTGGVLSIGYNGCHVVDVDEKNIGAVWVVR